MVFILTLTVLVMALVLLGHPLEDALIYASAALTTGPLAQIAGPEPLPFAALGDPARAVMALGMILGRLELLMLLSVLWPRLGAKTRKTAQILPQANLCAPGLEVSQKPFHTV